MPNTETDLREAFASLALDDGSEPDVTDLRARIAAVTTETDDPADDATESDLHVIQLDAARTTASPARRSRILFVAVAAAVIAALVGLAVVVLPDSSTPVEPATKLRELGGRQYPGTIAETYLEGKGSRTVDVPTREIPNGFVRRVTAQCSGGGGRFFVNGGGLETCSGSTTLAVEVAATARTVRVDAAAAVPWQLVFSLGPRTLTNGSVGPVTEDFRKPVGGGDLVLGSGAGTVVVPAGPDENSAGRRYSVSLTCSGTGVRLPQARSTDPTNVVGAGGIYTQTCFAGFEYMWENVTLQPGQRVTVEAARGTSWQVLIESM